MFLKGVFISPPINKYSLQTAIKAYPQAIFFEPDNRIAYSLRLLKIEFKIVKN